MNSVKCLPSRSCIGWGESLEVLDTLSQAVRQRREK